MVTDQQVDADINAFINDRRDFWHQSGAMNERGEFKQFLHVWSMSTRGASVGPSHINGHDAFPWIPIWDKPDVSEMAAYWHVTAFKLFPGEWDHFWRNVSNLRSHSMTNASVGPFWALLPQKSEAALAQQMTGMKRRITNQQFLKNKTQAISVIDAELHAALAPFRVMTPQQEIEDEAVRSDEIRRDFIQNGNIPALGWPPRCR